MLTLRQNNIIHCSQLSERKNEPQFKESLFWLGEVQTIQGKYTEAQDNYNLYISQNEGAENENVTVAKQRLESLDWAIKNASDSVEFYKVEQLGSDINSPLQ
jgi:hypothetical protein